ncbi:MAG: Ferrous iron transport protein [Phycisphaerales bacterium]|nr:Ferrous iron transport protein [Phycisphaerales bacterium]
MSTCCDTTPDRSPTSTLTLALAGNPNSGKTTIFNALTGLRQKVANYPGVTVEKKTGRCHLPATGTDPARWASIIDLPGTYSLISRSPDERVAMEVLRGLRADTPAPDAVIVVVDASNLQRNLYLVSQLIELGRPMIVALNMMDVAARRGLDVSPELLSKELGVPVIPVIGHKREGIDQLKAAIANARVAPLPDFPLPREFKDELLTVGTGLAKLDSGEAASTAASSGANKDVPLGIAVPPRAWICTDDRSRHLDRYQAIAERLLIGDTASDLSAVAARDPVSSLLASSRSRLATLGIEPMQADIEAHYRWIETVSSRVTIPLDELAAMGNPAGPGDVLHYESPKRRHLTDRVDAVLIHKVWGLVIFGLIMATIFVTIFWLAKPIMDGLQEGIKALGLLVTGHLGDGPIKDLLKDGIFAGVGAVVVFVPQIAILFFFLSVLEDSGYLARAAFLMDRLLAKVGLHGKSFIPLLSSFACAIPGIMATRTIEDRKSRLATILIAPFMSCSARLPVYTLLIGTFFVTAGAFAQAGIMLALYALGIVAAAGTAWIFKRSLLRGPTPAFILELPTYKVPQATQVARQVFNNTWSFLAKAGTTIFCLSIILWAMTYYPRLPVAQANNVAKVAVDRASEDYRQRLIAQGDGEAAPDEKQIADKAVGAEQIRHSIAGRIGHFMEPALRPLGYDWKMGVGLVGAFAAREVFVSTMGIIYSVGDPGEETADLSKAMRADVRDGKPVWTPLVAVSLLVWFVLAMQCMSTLAIVRRETGGWGWPIFMLVYMNALAYVVALGVYQIGRIWFV